MPWLENFLQTLYVHCFRFILLIVTCYFTTMLVDFLNIKHFSPSEDVKCVSTAALWSRDSFVILIFEPLLLFHIIWGSSCPDHPVFGFVSARSCRIISHLEAGAGTAIMWLNIKEEVGRADTELIIHIIIQVIKCNFHNIHNMWQGLTSDFLGYNSKLRPIPAEYSGLIVDKQYQELLGILCGIIIIAEPHQRRNLPVYILSQKISKYSLDEEWYENMKKWRWWDLMAVCFFSPLGFWRVQFYKERIKTELQNVAFTKNS